MCHITDFTGQRVYELQLQRSDLRQAGMTVAHATVAHVAEPVSSPPWSEGDRLAVLRAYGVLDTPREPAFDEITQVAALVCKAPIALVSSAPF